MLIEELKLMNGVGVKVESITTNVRPDYGPTQIRTIGEITLGMTLTSRRGHDQPTPFSKLKITEEPHQKDGVWWVKVRYNKGPNLSSISLADHGVVAYEDGLWNRRNWLEDSSRSRPSEEE